MGGFTQNAWEGSPISRPCGLEMNMKTGEKAGDLKAPVHPLPKRVFYIFLACKKRLQYG